MRELAVDVLVLAGAGCQLVCCIGVLAGRDAFDRLHYAGAACTLGPLLILAAILTRHGLAVQSLETAVAVALMLFAGPVLVNATARALRLAHDGQIEATPGERGEGGA